MKLFLQLFFISLPWFMRKYLYRHLYGFEIGEHCYIGWSIFINTHKLSMAEGSRIGHFNVIRNMECVSLGERAIIGTFNWIAGGAKSNDSKINKEFSDRRALLELGDESAIVARHIIDCADAIFIGRFSTIAGHRSQLLTHSIDLQANKQLCAPISIGSYCFLGTGLIILKGAEIPDYSVIGAGSVVTKKIEEGRCIYAGNPLRKIKEIKGAYKYFDREQGFVR